MSFWFGPWGGNLGGLVRGMRRFVGDGGDREGGGDGKGEGEQMGKVLDFDEVVFPRGREVLVE